MIVCFLCIPYVTQHMSTNRHQMVSTSVDYVNALYNLVIYGANSILTYYGNINDTYVVDFSLGVDDQTNNKFYFLD